MIHKNPAGTPILNHPKVTGEILQKRSKLSYESPTKRLRKDMGGPIEFLTH